MKCCTNKYVLNSLINVPPDPLAPAAFYVYEVGIDTTGFGGANFIAEITIDGTTYSWLDNPHPGGNIGGAISDGAFITQSLVTAFFSQVPDLDTWYAWGFTERNGIYSFGGIVTSEPHTITITYAPDNGGPLYVTEPFVQRVAVPNLCATHTGDASVDSLLSYSFVTPVNTGGTITLGVFSTLFSLVNAIGTDINNLTGSLIQTPGALAPSYSVVQNGGTYDVTFTNFFINLTAVNTDNNTFFPTPC